jgi:hypothetical protein
VGFKKIKARLNIHINANAQTGTYLPYVVFFSTKTAASPPLASYTQHLPIQYTRKVKVGKI